MLTKKLTLSLLIVGLLAGIFIGLSVNVSAATAPIPSWIKNTALWWGQGQISDDEFIGALQYLVSQGILKIPASTPPASTPPASTPPASTPPASTTSEDVIINLEKRPDIPFCQDCISPSTVHVKIGQKITWKNLDPKNSAIITSNPKTCPGDLSVVLGPLQTKTSPGFQKAGTCEYGATFGSIGKIIIE